MFRFFLTVIFLYLSFVFYGCSGFGYSNDSHGNEWVDVSVSKGEMNANIQKLSAENDELRRQVDIDKEMMERIRAENAKKLVIISERNRLLTKEIDKVKRDNQKIVTENEILKKKLASIQGKDTSSDAQLHKALRDTGRLKIKVLSGNGDLDSAKQVAKRLRKMGYSIKVIDLAPRSNFQITTIYFAPHFQDEAKRLRSKVDQRSSLKPLDWPSTYDLILVTGIQK
jgi:succinylglutamate desuccinylase